MDESRDYYTKWSKPDKERVYIVFHLYVESKKWTY